MVGDAPCLLGPPEWSARVLLLLRICISHCLTRPSPRDMGQRRLRHSADRSGDGITGGDRVATCVRVDQAHIGEVREQSRHIAGNHGAGRVILLGQRGDHRSRSVQSVGPIPHLSGGDVQSVGHVGAGGEQVGEGDMGGAWAAQRQQRAEGDADVLAVAEDACLATRA